ncbi:MAG: SPASM domain-containing protein [Firmicutes bacterium]|nr:SPASM domain-containing protein [Bacillota bacterium]MCL2771315.1 SPASM domain-containing protein [Bacillota bacterium]
MNRKQFKRIYIEISNSCNFNCTFCCGTKREKKHISVSDFKKVIAETKGLTDTVCLHLMGEPTLHPNFAEILKACDEEKVSVDLTTNGSRLKEAGEAILNSISIKKISISMNAYNSICEDELRRISDFAISAGDVGKTVELKFFNENEVYKQAKAYMDTRTHKNVFFRFINKWKWPEQTAVGVDRRATRKTFCLGGKTHIGILSDGTVVPCCLDSNGKIALGNIFETSLKEILKSERFVKLIEGFRNNKPTEELCKTCEFLK